MTKKPGKKTDAQGRPILPKYLYWRGRMIWVGMKDESGKWINRSTGFTVEQVDQAKQLLNTMLRQVEAATTDDGDPERVTVRRYMARWMKERAARGVRCAKAEKKKLEKYLGAILDMALGDVRTIHVRDEMRVLSALVKKKAIAPRTALHVYNALHNLFENALVDELITANPVMVKDGELPKKVDKDPEWRARATYNTSEVVQLISDARIPPARRVQYALKALAGMRHGEVAAICWRHYDVTASPLGRLNIVQAWDSHEAEIKDTKTGYTRAVPVHPTLAEILTTWRSIWERVYGREPTPDDYIAPARTLGCVAAGDAGWALKDDLDALGLRRDAGKHRDRGGHDLRSWYKTQTVEDGAEYLLIRRTTHAPPKDVDGGYERFSWKVLCREVAKLEIALVGEPLESSAESLQSETMASNRWKPVFGATPTGFEIVSVPADGGDAGVTPSETSGASGEMQHSRAETADSLCSELHAREKRARRDPFAALRRVEKMLRAGDVSRALAVAQRMLARVPGAQRRHAPEQIVVAAEAARRED